MMREANKKIAKLEIKKSTLEESLEVDYSYTPAKVSQRDQLVKKLGKQEHRLEMARLNKNKFTSSIETLEESIKKTEPLIEEATNELNEYQKKIKDINENYLNDFFNLFIDCLIRCEILSENDKISWKSGRFKLYPPF